MHYTHSVLLLTIVFCSAAQAIDVETTIEPAHAVDQSRVNTSMLIEEFQQYKSIANWHQSQHQLEIAKARLKQTESEYDRAKKLAGPKSFGDKRLAIAISQYDASLIEVSRLEYEVLLAKGSAHIHKLRLLEEGNPQNDYRKEIADTLATGLKLETESLKRRLDKARLIENVAKNQFEIARTLHSDGALSTAEFEKRELTYKEAVETTRSVEVLVKVSEKAEAAFLDNYKRL